MRVKTFLAVILTALLCLAVFPALAQGTAGGSFPEGVIEVPKGTQVAIHPDESVTITDCPVQIQAGDTYVVYLQDLPMGYIAEKVTTEGNRTTITGPHAEADIYSGLKESGTIVLTSDMFDVQAGTLRGDPSFSLLGLVEYEDGKVTFTIGDSTTGGLRTSVKVTYSNLAVNFAINDLNMSASLSGDWEVTLSGGTGGTPLGEIPVGEIRVFGVGKIALKINFSFEVNATFGGSFSSGFAIENMHGRLTRSFSTSKMEGEGRVNLSLKLTAGLDFVVASADVFAEIGVQTVQKGKLTYHEDREPHEVRCTDFKVYMFLKVGAEAHYAKQELGKVEFPVWDGDSSPAMLNVHIENGTKVDRCSEGMDTTTIEESFDGSVSDFETISETLGERYVYKKVIMPFDYVVDGSMYVEDGGIDLNGYQLTVNGDLIQSGGEIKVGDGQLTVTGDYYMVRDLIDDNPRQYGDSLLTFEEGSAAVSGKLVQAEGKVEIKRGTLTVGGNYEMHREYGENRYIDSTGCLVMQSSDGSLTIGGDLVLQSHSSGHILTAGTIHLAGNLMQSRTLEGTSHFQCLWEHTLDLLPGYEHALYFDDAQNNSLSVLSFADDLVANSSISIGHMDLGGHHFVIHGDLIKNNSANTYQVQDFILNGGTLDVDGSFYQTNGQVSLDGGKLNVGGDYIIASGASDYVNKVYETIYRDGICMNQPQDEAHIGGDFICAGERGTSLSDGVLYIGGDLQDFCGSFSAWNNHRTVMNGSGVQALTFRHPNAGFNIVEFQNKNIRLNGPWLRGFTLNDDLQLVLGTDTLQLNGVVDLNGHTLGIQQINGSFTLTGWDGAKLILGGYPLTITGDLKLGADLNLSGGTLNVQGNIHQQYGMISQDGGQLNVGGNYVAASWQSDYANKEYSSVYYAGIGMMQAQDEARIGGDFICTSQVGCNLSEGTLYIGGDLQDFCGSFSAWNNHRTVMNGSGVQALTFRHPNAGFNIVEFQNKNIRLNGPWLRGFTLNDDLQLVLGTDTLQLNGVVDLNGHTLGIQQINGSFTLTGWDGAKLILGGYPLTITGDLNLRADLALSGGTLNVQGNIHQQYGMISLDGGQLNVGGNYVAASWQSDYENKEYSSVYYAGIGMTQAQDEARIGGDFICTSQVGCNLSEGTLYIGGDLEDFQGNFSARNNHRTVLDGSGVQALTFRDQKAMFNIVEFRNSSIRLNGPWLHGFTLNDDLQLILGTDTLQLNGVVDLNGHTLGIQQINGSFTLTGWDGAKLILGGYPLTITGDLKLKADLALSGGTLNVQGNIHQSYGQISLDGGKLNVAGNYVAATWQSDYANKEYESTYYAGIGMSQAQDEARIGGDFIIASDVGTSLSDGTLYIGGDFEDFSGNFSARNNHRTVMNGSGAQALTFRNIRGGFATLELLQMPEQYSFNRAPCWDELILAQIPAFGPPDFMLPESLEAIEEAAFESVHTTAVEIPESCLRIGAYAFRNSTVRRIRFPASCEIDDTTFEDCGLILFYAAPGSTAEAYCSTHRNCIFVQEGE